MSARGLRSCTRVVRLLLPLIVAAAWTTMGSPADLPGTGQDAGKTVVYRDTWGVPHIYAPSTEAGLYAMGWAQAQDRPEDLLKNMLRGMGQLASVDGLPALSGDRIALMWDLYAGSRARAGDIRPDVLRHLRAFVLGINGFYEAHPEDVPAWWRGRRVDVFMVVAFSRLFLQSYSFDDGLRDVARGGVDPGIAALSRMSNQFVVSPHRTAVGAPILLSDLHLPWDGPFRWWECRIHAGALSGSGFTLAGMPYIGLGHNEHVAWAMTTGGPDTADAYTLHLDAATPPRYRYDGGWRPLRERTYTVRVKGTGEQVLRLSDSHHGPVVARSATTAYAIRSAYADVVDVNAVWLAFNTARDYRGVEAGLALLQVLPHNAMAADTAGNVYYQRAGRVPRRPAGYDWSQPVDGSTSTTEWRGLHPASDLLQVANPPQGYMQNCNVPPDAMMEGSPFTPDRTPAYLFADRTQAQAFGHARTSGWTNSRGARAVALLKAEPRMTVDRAMAIANDIRPFSAHHWVRVLVRAHATSGSLHAGDPAYAAGVRELQAWDCELRADSRPALKYAWWRTQLLADLGGQRLASLAARIDGLREPLGETYDAPVLSDDELRTVAASFARALARMRSELGTLDRAYGDVFRVGRGDRSWPVEGGMAERLGLTTLRSVSYGAPRSDDTRWGAGGQTSTILVVLTRPIHSWTMVPLGQSDRPDSAHYRDQAEKLFSLRQMKPSWWTPEGLSGHIESRTVLAAAGMAIQ